MRTYSRRAVLLAGAGSAAVLRASHANAQTTPTLRVSASINDTQAAAHFAEAGGFYKAAGLNVEITDFVSTGAIVSAVVGGAIDLAIATPITIVAAREQGIPVAIVAPGALYKERAPTTLLMVSKNSPLKSASDLEGKTIATASLRGITEMAVFAWMLQNHADPSLVKYTEMSFASMVPALERGAVDAAQIAEPILSESRGTGREFANFFAAIAKEFYISTWFAREDWLAKNRELAHRFVQTTIKTQDWANGHHPETGRVLQTIAKLSDESAGKMMRAPYGTVLDVRLLQPLIDAGKRVGILKGTVSAKEMIVSV